MKEDVFIKRFRMLCNGMKQSEVCEKLQISQGLVSEMIRGTRKNPSASTILKIADGFHVSTDWLFGRESHDVECIQEKEIFSTIHLSDESVAFLKDGENERLADLINKLIHQANAARKIGEISTLDALTMYLESKK